MVGHVEQAWDVTAGVVGSAGEVARVGQLRVMLIVTGRVSLQSGLWVGSGFRLVSIVALALGLTLRVGTAAGVFLEP